jgi:hypothetical protein
MALNESSIARHELVEEGAAVRTVRFILEKFVAIATPDFPRLLV